MQDELIQAVYQLLTHNDAESGDTTPEELKLDAFEHVIDFIECQGDDQLKQEAIQELRTVVQVIQITKAHV
jgi:hypothetical protein